MKYEDEIVFNPSKNDGGSINLSEYLDRAYDKFGGDGNPQVDETKQVAIKPALDMDDSINFDDPHF